MFETISSFFQTFHGFVHLQQWRSILSHQSPLFPRSVHGVIVESLDIEAAQKVFDAANPVNTRTPVAKYFASSFENKQEFWR